MSTQLLVETHSVGQANDVKGFRDIGALLLTVVACRPVESSEVAGEDDGSTRTNTSESTTDDSIGQASEGEDSGSTTESGMGESSDSSEDGGPCSVGSHPPDPPSCPDPIPSNVTVVGPNTRGLERLTFAAYNGHLTCSGIGSPFLTLYESRNRPGRNSYPNATIDVFEPMDQGWNGPYDMRLNWDGDQHAIHGSITFLEPVPAGYCQTWPVIRAELDLYYNYDGIIRFDAVPCAEIDTGFIPPC